MVSYVLSCEVWYAYAPVVALLAVVAVLAGYVPSSTARAVTGGLAGKIPSVPVLPLPPRRTDQHISPIINKVVPISISFAQLYV